MPEPGLDRRVALSRVGGDEELLKEIAVIFLEDCPRLMTEIQAAILAKDPQKLEAGAHALKGSVANFGAQAAVASAFQLEQMGRERRTSGQDFDDAIDSMFEALQKALAGLFTELAAL